MKDVVISKVMRVFDKLPHSVKQIDLSFAYKFILFIFDIIFINFSSMMAMFLRFEWSFSEVPVEYLESIVGMMIPNTIITCIIFVIFRLYTSLWRFASIKELWYIAEASVVSVFVNIILYYFNYRPIYRSYFFMYVMMLFLFTCITRFAYRLLRLVYRGSSHGKHMRHTMIIGAGEACNVIMKELELSRELDAKVCCIIDDNEKKYGTYIHGIKVVGGRNDIVDMVKKYGITEIILAIPSASKQTQRELLEICQTTNCELKILPGMYQLVNGDVTVEKLRNVKIGDLLGRAPIQITTEAIGRYVSGKVVLITGGGGSIGSELCRQIAANGVRKLIIFDIYENNVYDIQQELKREYPNLEIIALIGSVRNTKRVENIFEKYRPNIVYHAAAHKHVPLMEDSPNEAIKNNVFGTYKLAVAADTYEVEKFVLISTDKAVNPTNVMGASKRICEMIVQLFSQHSGTEFVAVRFGNVLGSNGSVIPLFKKQIEEGGPVTVTHPDVIRYFMTIPEAVSLVLQAGAKAKGGEIFVLDMGEPVKIVDLAEKLIRLSGYVVGTDIEIKYTGLRPGEKLYEELLMDEELKSTDHNLIHIGKPLHFDEEELLEKLERLYEAVDNEVDNIKELVNEIVPTYSIRREDKIRDRRLREAFSEETAEKKDTKISELLKRL